MAKTHKDQHFVAQSYLAAWTDPSCPPTYTPYLWLFSKGEKEGKKKSPKNIFSENEIYTIHKEDGERDLSIEDTLSMLETKFSKIRKNSLDSRKFLTPEEHVYLIAFAVAQQCRTPAFRNHHREQAQQVLDLMEEVSDRGETLPDKAMPYFSSNDGYMTEEDFQKLKASPLQTILPMGLFAQLPLIASMMVAKILCTESQPGFITSDNPLVWFNPEAYKLPLLYRNPTLACPKIEITLPLSPRLMLLLHHRNSPQEKVSPVEYVNIPEEVVNEFNRRTHAHCNEEFVVNQNYTNPIWYNF